MSVIFHRGRARIEANLTPLIDVTFLLIVFFVLVSQIVDLESVQMDLPKPAEPASELAGDEQRAVINIIPAGGGRIAGYRFAGRTFGPDATGIEALTSALAALYQHSPTLRINLRADRKTHFQWIEPVFGAVVAATTRSGRDDVTAGMNLVVIREE